MSEQQSSSNKVLYILIAILIAISIIQTVFLVRQSQRQTRIEQQQSSRFTPVRSSLLAAKAVPQSQTPAQRRAAFPTQAFFASDPWEEMDAMQQRMNNLMRHAFTFGSPLFQGMGNSNQSFDFTPAVDLEETPDAYIVKSDLPGLQKDKINLTVRNGMLTIEGVREVASEKKDENAGFYAQERSYGSFARSLPLPGPVDESRVNAQYKDGVLVITLPKAKEASTPQKVSVQ